ncbi:MAG TPA: AAC(3) family N-acetyltransferase [Anaerolineales bacterium]|nr:AAC(3) family N-acetyltransferase [Anaerolineales bacterium]
MLDHTQLKASFEALDLAGKPVIAHASLRPFGYIQGGAEAVLEAMLASFASVIMPTHTYKTEIIPDVGPPNNGITYGSGHTTNQLAEPFQQDMRADPMMGILPETLRNHPSATRTAHPILSFAGVNADFTLFTQTLYEPMAPLGALAEQDGWVVLINVDHTVNTSIHYAEKLAGRKQFVRWALVGDRVVECPNYPGDSLGFQAIEPYLSHITRRVNIGEGFVQAVPLQNLFEVVQELIKKDPLALLCERTTCERCNAVRTTLTT